MPAALPVVLRNFCECSSRLSQIFTETKQVFEDINTWGLYDDAQVLSVELLAEEELEVAAVSSKPPCIVILGQSIYCKARLANEFFKQEVLPPFGEAAGSPCPTRAVRIRHGDVSCASLSLPDDYTLIDDIEVSATQIKPIPRRDIVVTTEEASETDELAPLEITLNHGLLRPGAQIFIAPSCCGNTEKLFRNCVETMLPIFVYGLEEERLTEKEMEELAVLQTITNIQPVFFVRVPPPGQQTVDTDPPDGAPDCTRVQVSRHTAEAKETRGSDNAMLRSRERAESIRSQLSLLGYLNHFGAPTNYKQTLVVSYYDVDSRLTENFMNFTSDLTAFVQSILQSFLVNATVVLNNAHTRCLSMFIMSAFDMARDLMVTPKKLEFAEKREAELYQSLMQLAVSKQHEIRSIIQQTIISMTEQLGKKAENYEFVCVSLNEDGGLKSSRDLKLCTSQIQDLVLHVLNMAIADKLINSVNMLRDLYTGTLTRCLESLEKTENNAVDGSKTTDALKQILTAAYHVEITFKSSSSLICVVLEKMKQLIQSMPWKSPPRADGEWKKKVALDMLNSLSEARLAKSISSQIRDRLNKSHESFASALRQLELKHSGRMDRIEMERLRLRKVHAPKAAKLALESTSLKDLAIYGMPRIGREIGRGQYGVVYSCDKWGDFSPCAIKSVVPPDEKHWNDLALEFYYTKNIPEHERIVSLRGSVIDYMYCGGLSPAVLLIMDRLQKDLHAAIKQHLDWGSRLQVAIDVVEGIRFLHSQGLVHRDIKMKNVLLDKQNRGKLTDLGFCKPEAMMSGSIVGTPIHMAPELFSGRYDNSVDTYAFGILFWYVCAGKVYLPMAFDQCTGKDHLWQAVKKGLRPERLPTFDDECWTLMQQCWDGNPDNRPLLGNVEEQLKEIQQRLKKNSNPRSSSPLRGNNRQKYVYVRRTKHHN